MWNWFTPKNDFIPPQFVEDGQIINGLLFPSKVRGFTRFNYNDAFKNIPWNPIKSYWNRDIITWCRGEIEGFDGIHEQKVSCEKPRIHKKWLKLKHFPCFWRRTRVFIDESQPVGKMPCYDMWPRSDPKKLPSNNYSIIYWGEVAVHETCKPIPHSAEYEHEIFVNPLQTSCVARYYYEQDYLIPFIKKDGKWSITW
jgi:hypothetical protein